MFTAYGVFGKTICQLCEAVIMYTLAATTRRDIWPASAASPPRNFRRLARLCCRVEGRIAHGMMSSLNTLDRVILFDTSMV